MAFSGFKPGVGGLGDSSSSVANGGGVFWSKMDVDHKVNDSGYDSLLLYSSITSGGGGSLSSSVSTSFLASDASNSSSLFSQPSTPVKQQPKTGGGMLFSRHNTSNSPDLKHQYVADINAFYLASLRSPAKTASAASVHGASDKFAQAFKSSCNFADFSASNSASPVKLSDSPKFVNPDDFLRERDTITSKLLRSPAFKLQPQQPSSCFSMFSPQRSLVNGQFEVEASSSSSSRPFIKSFSSRFFKATGSRVKTTS